MARPLRLEFAGALYHVTARVGHLFQIHYKVILADKGAYLLELCSYIALSSVRDKSVKVAGQWPWGYRCNAPARVERHGSVYRTRSQVRPRALCAVKECKRTQPRSPSMVLSLT